MEKIVPSSPVLIMLYGFPGSGKTHFSRQFCQDIQCAHLEEDRIRAELFDNPKFTKEENHIVSKLMNYMATEFLKAGISVVYDANAMRVSQRRALREMAKEHKAKTLMLWFQVDADTAYLRNAKRDKRKLDDRYAAGFSVEGFKAIASMMQQPQSTEEYVVVSGKHGFESQLSNAIKKLVDMLVIPADIATRKMVKPGLVNLVESHQPVKPGDGKQNIVLR